MTTRLDLSFGDADNDFYGYARAGSSAFVHTKSSTREFAQATLTGERLQAGEALEFELTPQGSPSIFADGASHQPVLVRGVIDAQTLQCAGTLIATPDTDKAPLVRDLGASHTHEGIFALRAHRARKKDSHADERIEALALRGEETEWAVFSDPRLSSTYGPDGELLRAGLELWETDESTYAERLGAEVVCAITVGSSQVALCRWHYNDTLGAGHYVLDARD